MTSIDSKYGDVDADRDDQSIATTSITISVANQDDVIESSSSPSLSSPSSSSSSSASPPLSSTRPFILLLCLSSFLFSLKPSEPFLTNYILDVKLLSEPELNDDVYPIWTYSYLFFLLPMGVLAEFCGAPTVVALGFGARLATRIVLLYGDTLGMMQLSQLTFAAACATEPALYTLLYSYVPSSEFTSVTGLLAAAILSGHLVAGTIGQAMVSSGVPLVVLFQISLANVAAGTVAFGAWMWIYRDMKKMEGAEEMVRVDGLDAIVDNSIDNGDASLALDSLIADNDNSSAPVVVAPSSSSSSSSFCQLFAAKFRHWYAVFLLTLREYAHPIVLLWSTWMWLGNGVLELVLNYNTSLFYQYAPSIDYNGAVVAMGRGAAAVAAIVPKYVGDTTSTVDLASLVSFDLFGTICLFAMSAVSSLYLSYVLFILFYAAMQFLNTMASANIANNLSTRHYTAMFTLNTFISLSFQTVTQVIIGHDVLHMPASGKFSVLAWQLAGVTAMFVSVAAWMMATSSVWKKRAMKEEKIEEEGGKGNQTETIIGVDTLLSKDDASSSSAVASSMNDPLLA